MKRIWLISLMLIVTMVGCYQKGTVKDTGLYEPYRIADINIPLADKLHTYQFDRVSELERDGYGRGYFSYKTYSVQIHADVEIHIISQSLQEDAVLYYPDTCYMIRLEDGVPFTQEQIDQFKLLNDWDLPLKEEKTYSVSYSEWYRDIVNEEDICDAVRRYLKLDASYGVLYNGLEMKNGNEQLLFVQVFPRDESSKRSGAGTYYLMIYNDIMYRPIVMSQQVEDPMNCQEQIICFRGEWMAKDMTE